MRADKQIKLPGFTSKISQYSVVLAVIAIVVVLCKPLANQQSYHIVSFILLFVISIMAAFLGIGPILLASTISALVWNYFFIPPHLTFHIEKTEDKLMFVSFFVIALLNGILTNRIRRQERMVGEREDQANTLFQLTKELSKASGLDRVVEVAMGELWNNFKARSQFILQDGEGALDFSNYNKADNNQPGIDVNVAEWVYINSSKAGRFTSSFSDSKWTYYPLTGKRLNPGVVVIDINRSFYRGKDTFWDTYFTQVSSALEREFLGEFAVKARILDESEKLYKTLFNLISHEFRIPIAAIMGASDSLIMSRTTEKNKKELYNEIFKASERLNHLIENLLNMSRLESGKISVRPDWCDINDLLNKVIKILKQELELFHFISDISPEMPLVKLDFGLIEQVIYNLIQNSVRHTPYGSTIRFGADYKDGYLVIRVEDNGPGFPPEMLSKVFDKFFKVDNSRTGGLGLGLSIVKGLAEAHKGTVKAENLKTGGARFTVYIPTEITDMKEIKLE
jgi:K+-sensing histidine kinase KdpD